MKGSRTKINYELLNSENSKARLKAEEENKILNAKYEALKQEYEDLKKNYDEVKKEKEKLAENVVPIPVDDYKEINKQLVTQNEIMLCVAGNSQESIRIITSLYEMMKMKNYIPGGDQVLPTDQSQDPISADRTEADVQDPNILPEDRPPVASPEQPPSPVASPEQILGAMGIDPLFPVDQAEDSVSSNVGVPGASDTDSELQILGASAGASAGHSASMASGSSPFPRVSPLIVEDNFTYLTNLDSRLNTLMRDLTRDEKLEAYSHVKGMDVPTVLYNIHHNR